MSEYNGEGMDIRALVPNSLLEWDGKLVTVVVTAGCNWRCPFCHAGQFILRPQELPAIQTDDIFALLEKEQGWIDAVMISGGEPTLQPGLVPFVRAIKDRGVGVCMQTNGSHPEVLQTLLDEALLDGLCMDYKAPLDERLLRVTQVTEAATNLEGVKKSFALARESGLDREYRTTLCPAFIDEATLEEMAYALETGGRWSLQQYETLDVLNFDLAGDRRYTREEMERLEAIAKKHHPHVILRTGRDGNE